MTGKQRVVWMERKQEYEKEIKGRQGELSQERSKGWGGREKKKGKRTMGNRRGKRVNGRAEEGQKTLELKK